MVFEVVCSNRKPIQYQWYFIGTKLEGETKDTLERCGLVTSMSCDVWSCDVLCLGTMLLWRTMGPTGVQLELLVQVLRQ